jgi:hypothetical protein
MAGIAAAVGIVPARARVHAPTRSASIAFPLHSGAIGQRMMPAGRTIVSASFGDPGYWDDVVSLMTPDVNVNLGPESLAALAIGGVLVLGHSWESIEASRGWKQAKAQKEAATSTSPSSPSAAETTKKPRTTAAAKPMTKAEREAAIAEARAERAAELDRRRRDPLPPVPKAEIVVCTNNACAKRGAKELKAELERVGASAGTDKCTVKGARCMDACGAGCVVKVNGAGGLETFMHVGASEAAAVMELATGERVTSEAPAR